MKLLIDDANIEKIKKIYEYYAIDGVTTNPSILAKNGKNPYETLKEIREFIGKEAELHVQVVSSTADGMIEEGKRIDNLGTNGIEVTRKIHDIFENNGLKTQILAASFKNSLQVLELCEYGVGASTVAPDIIEGFINNPNISSAVEVFTEDFEGLCGKGKTMLNCD